MDVTCVVCGETFTARDRRARYCSDRCRKRKARGADIVPLPATEPEKQTAPQRGPCYTATLRTLTEADRHDTPLGVAALALAQRIDNPGMDTGSALASVVGRLESTLAAAMKGAGAATAPGQLKDELAARRAAHGA